MPLIRWVLIYIFSLVMVSQAFAAPAFSDDARLVKGKLANGFNYYIYPSNDEDSEFHREKISLKLFIELGVSDELENQLGYVNLMNYMAAGDNYYTYKNLSFFEINLGLATEGVLLKSLNKFKDIATGGHINQVNLDDALENSRAITYEVSTKPLSREAAYNKIYNGDVVSHPYGTQQTMGNVSVKKLKHFFEYWYQPQLMHVVVAGQINPAKVKQQIERLFSGLTSSPIQRKSRPNYKIPKGIHHIVTSQIAFSRLYISIPIFGLDKPLENAKNYQNQIAHQVINRGIDLFLRTKAKIDKRVGYVSTHLQINRDVAFIELFSDQFIHNNLTADFTAATQFNLEALTYLQQNGFDQKQFEQLIQFTIEHIKYLGSPLHANGKPDDITHWIKLNIKPQEISMSAETETAQWVYFAKNIKQNELNRLLKQILSEKLYIITMSHEAFTKTQKIELNTVFDNYNFEREIR